MIREIGTLNVEQQDDALHSYMRARVGDAPVSTAPGGTLSGDVNV